MDVTSRPRIEAALARAVVWTLLAASSSLLLLAVPEPQDDRLLVVTTVHLAALVALGLAVAWDLTRLIDRTWFAWLRPFAGALAAGASVVALTAGAVALVTMATSAALRLEPSLQYLQLLSALDIAFATTAIYIGVRWLRGNPLAAAAALVVAVVCVWSIWRYLSVVGFTADGGWLVDAAALFTYVLPYDMAAAAVAVATMVAGARRISVDAAAV